MAISIDNFRRNLKVDVSKKLVDKIMSKYENSDFSIIDTNNGNKLREIDLYNEDNKKGFYQDEVVYFLNKVLKTDYLNSKNAFLQFAGLNHEDRKQKSREISAILRKSLYSRPDSLSLKSGDILNNPQKDESVHILTLNVESSDIISITRSLYNQLTKYDIPFDIEIPKTVNMNSGTTEAIKLHVPTMDLEDTINAINRLDKVYKNKIKAPNMFNANIEDLIGYDSLIDINGTRTSDLFGSTLIKALDNTLIELGADETFDGVSVVEYLKNASNKDEARKRVYKEVFAKKSNEYDLFYETLSSNFEKIVKEEKIPLDLENIFASELAQSELNVEFGVVDDEEVVYENEIVNENEIELEEPEKVHVLEKAADAAKSLVSNIKTNGIESLLSSNYIQPAITFGAGTLEQIHEEAVKATDYESLKTNDPSVQVIEPIVKDNFNELPEPVFDKIEEDIEPALMPEEIPTQVEEAKVDVPKVETQVVETPVQEQAVAPVAQTSVVETEVPVQEESIGLPGEDAYITQVAPKVPTEPIVVNTPVVETPAPVESTPVVPPVEEPVSETPEVVTALATDPVLYDNNDKETSLYEDEAVSIAPTNDVNGEVQAADLNELNEVPTPVETTAPVEEVKEEPAFKDEVVETPANVEIPEATDIAIEDDSQVEVQSSNDTEVYQAPVEETHEDVVIPDDTDKTQILKVIPETKPSEPIIPEVTQSTEEDEISVIDSIMKEIEEAENNVDEKTIELSELGNDLNKITETQAQPVQAQPVQTEVPNASKLTQDEAVAVVANNEPVKQVDPVKQQIIDKYNGVSMDPQIFDFQIKDEDDNVLQKRDGSPYTFLDYLEYNKILEAFPLDSRIYLKDSTRADSVDGRTFIREYVLPAAVDGNKSVKDIMEWYVKSVNNIKEVPKKKSFFGGFMKK